MTRSLQLSCVLAAFAISTPTGVSAQLQSDARSAFAIHASVDVTSPRARPALLEQEQPEPQSPGGGRIALQFLAASAGAVGGGSGAFFMFRDVGEQRVVGDAGYTRAGNVAYLVGSMGGAALGAHLVGRSMGGRSPLWATTLGALVGTAPLLALGIDEPYMPLFGIALGWIPQAALATGGFNVAESHERLIRSIKP